VLTDALLASKRGRRRGENAREEGLVKEEGAKLEKSRRKKKRGELAD